MNTTLGGLIEKHLPNLKAQGFQLLVLLEQEPIDYQSVKALAHMLKGSSASLGFRAYSEACLQIETVSKEALAGSEQGFERELILEFKDRVQNLSLASSELYESTV